MKTILDNATRCGDELAFYLNRHGPHSFGELRAMCIGRWKEYMLRSVLKCDGRFVQDRDGWWGVR